MHPIRTSLPRALLGEAPRYDASSSTLSWVDLLAGHLWIAHVRPDAPLHAWLSEPTLLAELPAPLSCAVRAGGDDDWILAVGGAVVRWSPETGPTVLAELEPDAGRTRLNDGAVDAAGRFWVGSMGVRRPLEPLGRLHVLDGCSPARAGVRLEGLLAANGIAWSPDGTITYVVDSGRRLIHRLRTGAASPLEPAGPPLGVPAGTPDGIVVDGEGCLWVALWDGGSVVRLSPEGGGLARVDLPCSRPTACALIGSRLLVTTAQVTGEEGSGRTYAMDVEAGGPPANRASLLPGPG
ncbi:SMP-30/gluconolactonase/LRE family protein [Streptomyces parvus]|uniref:SMP-30/gluconolactonase/LRE family protein n=1 Tax=Streptomyces parvus TaxID=66428 RepID=A0A7K3S063_9ACTN|nr:SMP-30/gluconolactonase/LRE family protein [Streptomyces parvus]NEC20302.1 SMP-30/gluconolactonase/LRE family protein [Streptomyces parvus]